MRRALLRVCVKLGLLASLGAFLLVFVYGLFGPMRAGGETIDLGGLPPGAARLEAWNNEPVWIVHRSGAQLAALDDLPGHVSAPEEVVHPGLEVRYRSLRSSYGVYLAATRRSGVLVQYLRERPDRLDPAVPWQGGFIDPGSDALFDTAGRRYHSARGEPLAVPPHRYVGETTIRLGEW